MSDLEHAVGMIGMSCGELARFSETYASLMGLRKPPGTIFMQCRSMSIADNWNQIARMFMESSAEWLFLTNDDQTYAPDTLIRLLARNVDVVTGLYLSRAFPFSPVIHDDEDADGFVRTRYLQQGESGLVPVISAGDGALLIRRHVMEKIGDPWWALSHQNHADKAVHDMNFSRKVRAAGFQMYCDLDVTPGHLGVFAIFPKRQPDGTWITMLTQGANALTLPAATSPLAMQRGLVAV